jgi:hypothetical protein
MKQLKNIEVFHIETTDKGTFAYISFQDLNNIDNINNGYDHIRVPMNLRPIQLSVRDNILVDQSIQKDLDGVVTEVTKVLNNHNS